MPDVSSGQIQERDSMVVEVVSRGRPAAIIHRAVAAVSAPGLWDALSGAVKAVPHPLCGVLCSVL